MNRFKSFKQAWSCGNYNKILIFAGLAGIVFRLLLSGFSFGTNDLRAWLFFVEWIDRDGLVKLYQDYQKFNHPPLVGYLVYLLFILSQKFSLSFPFLFRLPGITADLVSAVFIYRFYFRNKDAAYASLAFMFFCWNPVSILISGFHGNTDSLYAALCLIAVLFLLDHKYFLGGLFLGLSANVKIIPLILCLPLCAQLKQKDRVIKFVSAVGLCLVPFLIAGQIVGPAFYRNIFGYNSGIELWGVQLFIFLGSLLSGSLSLLEENMLLYQAIGRYIIIAAVIALSFYCYFYRSFSVLSVSVLTFFAFLITTPGIGVQYFIILVPLLFLVSLRWGVTFSYLTGILIGAAYLSNIVCWYPLEYKYQMWNPLVFLIGLGVWVLLIRYTVILLRSRDWSANSSGKTGNLQVR